MACRADVMGEGVDGGREDGGGRRGKGEWSRL
jgi:hypothetical protein